MFQPVRSGALAGALAVMLAIPAPGAIADDETKTRLAAAEPATATEEETVRPTTGASPLNGRLVHQATGEKLCIGGVLCPEYCTSQKSACAPSPSLTIKLDRPTRINTIQLSAHDNIGKTRRSRLLFKVNGKQVAETLVYRLGSTLSIDVGATGELITIESAHQYNGFLRGGEEAVIWDVYVFGDGQG